MPIQLRAQVAPTYSMPRFESGNVSAPTIAFDASQSTGLSYADGIAVSHNGAQVLHIGNTVTVDTVLVGNGAGLSNIAAANVTGLTAALDVIDASSVSSNVFVGDGAGLSNIAAANVTGLTEALDVIDASSVTANSLTTSNLSAVSNEITVTGHLRPDTNVVWDLGSAERKWRDLYLSSGTLFLGNASVTESDGALVIPVLNVTGNISAAKFVGDGSGLTGIQIPPSITSVTITDDSWNPIDDLALSTTSIGYLVIEGNNFEVGTTVSVGGTPAASISVVNSTTLQVSVNPLATGSYDVVVQTGGGSTTKINAVSFDPIPVWSTGSSLGNVYYSTAFNVTLAASDGGSAITYSNTSALPPSTTLASNGVLQGNISLANSATYNFSVEATDAQLQSALRIFTLAYNTYLYLFSTATFTPDTQTGTTGPSLAQAISGLSGPEIDTWKNNTAYFTVASGVQKWTVPQSGTYRITCIGASGGASNAWGAAAGGLGASMRGDFVLQTNDQLSILVGQAGLPQFYIDSNYSGGGGGGSFVWKSTNDLLIAAGGGGGAGYNNNAGLNASTGTSGTASGNGNGAGGTNGSGGEGNDDATHNTGGGGGWLSSGGATKGGSGITNAGGVGGGTNGGFGGGGGSSTYEGGGGGGGYSGGGATSSNATRPGGGGGGSYNSGSNQQNTAGVGTGAGSIIIVLVS